MVYLYIIESDIFYYIETSRKNIYEDILNIKVNYVEGCNEMAYEDIYKGLTEEEKERMLKMDIPQFEVVGEFEMTEQEKEKSRKDLLRLIKKFGEK